MVPRLRSGSDDHFIARAGYGVYTKAVYEAVYTCAKMKAMKFTATRNRVIAQHDLLWPAAVAGIRMKNGRHSQMSDFAIKASAKALPTSKTLQHRYGDTIIDDITCPLCGGFPIRLAKTQHLDKQRDSEKKKNAIRKSSARNDQIRGLFGSPP